MSVNIECEVFFDAMEFKASGQYYPSRCERHGLDTPPYEHISEQVCGVEVFFRGINVTSVMTEEEISTAESCLKEEGNFIDCNDLD
jgi:hypothetical protein